LDGASEVTDWRARSKRAVATSQSFEFPPREGFIVTHFLTVADVQRSADFYHRILGATVLRSGEPAFLQIANSWLILNVGGGPTDDKPAVTLEPPQDPDRVSSFLNLRVADIQAVYQEWSQRGAQFLTEPKDHTFEIRCYIRDPDGYIIEVGQSKGFMSGFPSGYRLTVEPQGQ
jgi:predicted enzyme related to lactoylglutathione lyase